MRPKSTTICYLIAIALVSIFAIPAYAAWDICDCLTGGSDGCVDAIDGANISDGDVVIAIVEGEGVFHLVADATSGATESSPNVISPDANAGAKRWRLENAFAKIISADTTFYVSTTGSDTTGNGTAGAPWATLGHAIQYLNGYYWDVSSVDVTVRMVDSDSYSENAGIVVNHPCASSLTIQGSDATATTPISITGAGNDGSRDYITVSGDETSDYPADVAIVIQTEANIGVYTVYGSVYGASTTITLNQSLNDNTHTGGAVSALAWSDDVVITFTGAQGLIVSDGTSVKLIDGIKFVSSPAETTAASIEISKNSYVNVSDVLAVDFAKGFFARTSSTIDGTVYSIGHTMGGIYLDGNSVFKGGAYACHGVSGEVANSDYGFYALSGSTIDCTTCVANGNQDGFRAYSGSRVLIDSTYAYDNDAYGVYLGDISEAAIYNPSMSGNGTADYAYSGGSKIFQSNSRMVIEEIQAEDNTGLLLKNDAGDTVAKCADDQDLEVVKKLGVGGVDPTYVLDVLSGAHTSRPFSVGMVGGAGAGAAYCYNEPAGDATLVLENNAGTSRVVLRSVGASSVAGSLQAADFYSGDGSQGLTQDVTVKGSDGNNCVLSFKDGLLTGETCP